jgi:hypothetical protein
MNKWIVKHPGAWDQLFTFLRKIPLENDKGIQTPIEVRWSKPKRTNPQNRYLFGVVYKTFAQGLMELGKGPVNVDSIHYICKEQFMPRVGIGTTGRTMPLSTTKLCKSGEENAFSDYVEQIKELAAHYGIFIPDPNEETP